ncbi:unnamed protein product [Rotaria sordida]|uniref:Tetratricopeptide repeat protein n=1 Tax=Rotaria sordida TaxID=392033 RepID=A0A819M3X8_9BILA|nr:unnamed protein product [Rotaria sordida]CAF3973270.1 unnamed protein product [Rotaria sordida]
MRGFLSTTLDREVAKTYAELPSEDLAVLFEITVELDQVPSMILADVSKFSPFPVEKEILFGLNATFEIDEQVLDDCNRWIIRMHATNRGQEITNDYLRQRQSEISIYSSSSLISINFTLAQLLIEMGQYVKAINFLEKILPTTDDQRANLYFILADAKISSYHSAEHALDQAIPLLKESKELFISLNNDLGVANSLRRLGDAFVLNEQYDEAIPIYQEARQLYKQISIHDQQEHIAKCYNGLADAYLEQRRYEEAASYYLRALKKRKAHLPDEHPAIARSYYSLGRYYYIKGNNNQNAALYLNKALERKKKVYPSDHPSILCNQRLLEEVLAALKN